MATGNFTNNSQYLEEVDSNSTASFTLPGSNFIAALTPLYWVLFIIIIIINGFLLALFIRYKSVRKSLNYFILSQIVTDLTVGLVALPVSMILPRQSLVANTSLNTALCLFAVVSPISIMTMMLWGVALTAIDRFIAVFRPSSYKMLITKMRCSFVALSLWVLVVLFYLLPLFNLETLGGIKWRSYCNGIYRYPSGYLHVGVYIHLALPIVVTSAAYISMYIVIRKKHRSSMIQSSNPRVLLSLKKAVSAAKMCLVTTALIVFGWSPLLIVLNVVPIYDVSFIVRLYAYGISMLLAAMVSALNPLVYFLRLKAIRQVLRNGLQRKNRVDVSRITGVTPSGSDTGATQNPTNVESVTRFTGASTLSTLKQATHAT